MSNVRVDKIKKLFILLGSKTSSIYVFLWSSLEDDLGMCIRLLSVFFLFRTSLWFSPSSWLDSCACTTKLLFYCTEPFCAMNISTAYFSLHRAKLEKRSKAFCTDSEPFFATKQRIWKICYTTAQGRLCISHTRWCGSTDKSSIKYKCFATLLISK